MFAASTLAQAVAAIEAHNATCRAEEVNNTLSARVAQVQESLDADRRRVTAAPRNEKLEGIIAEVNKIDATLGATIRAHGNTEIIKSFIRMREVENRNRASLSLRVG